MKKLFFLFLLAPAIALAQYVTAEFVVLNNGTDADYNQLEKVWKVYHQKSVDSGEKLGWSVWKRTPKDNDGDGAAHYVIFNQFTSKDQRDKMMKGWSMSKATSIMKAGLRFFSAQDNKSANTNLPSASVFKTSIVLPENEFITSPGL